MTSPKALALECRRLGIEPPSSTDHKSQEFEMWAAKYAEHVPLVEAIQKWRSINRTIAVLEAMQIRQANGVLPVELKFFGASHTGRWSGSGGLNLQNLPKSKVCGVDCRGMLIPRNGNKFIVADYATIEARVLLWLAGDKAMLEKLASGLDLYEAAARRSGIYTDPRPMKEADPALRQFQKCVTLGCGFGLGANKFVRIVQQWTGQEITLSKAQATIKDFRRSNPAIVQLWQRLDRVARSDKTFDCVLPSGRTIRYFDLQLFEGELSGRVERGDHRKRLWGGVLTENTVQAVARDILAEAVLRLEAAGLPVVLTVHDEIVVEAPANAADDVKRIMEQPPEWAEGCPIAVECKVCDRYGK